MRSLSLLTLSLLLSFCGALEAKEFCQKTWEDFRKEIFETHSTDYSSRLAFSNPPGTFNTGLCWWHSRFQRNAHYLLVYKPSLPIASRAYYRYVIKSLTRGDKVHEIPGFSNLAEFSREFESEITAALGTWQVVESVFKFGWLLGVSSNINMAEQMRLEMDRLYELVVQENLIVYQMLQRPGLDSHAWLVVDMLKTPEGYFLDVIDSTFPKHTFHVEYKYGQEYLFSYLQFLFEDPSTIKFSPYTQRMEELVSIQKAITNYCHAEGQASQ